MARNKNLNFDTTRTFKTVENLEASLSKSGIPDEYLYFIVIVPNGKNAGRFTAVFTNASSYQVLVPINAGYMVVG